jgi:hypothetical protein
MSVSIASGAAPPTRPECAGAASVRTSTKHSQIPRREAMSVGSPSCQLPPSATTTTSAASSPACSRAQVAKVPRPVSSSPSITTVTPTGGCPPKARSAPRCMAMPDLSSAAPRP